MQKMEMLCEERSLIEAGDHVIVGVSGGADSICLFLGLEQLRKKISFTMSVVHVEHGVRGEESKKDQRFVEEFCMKHNTPCSVYEYNVPELAKASNMSIEEMGRFLRYASFEKEKLKIEAERGILDEKMKIAVAHHMDDNVETMLFHMCRGTGIRGLIGMYPIRNEIIRPLLRMNKKEILEELEKQGQEFCVDETNCLNDYSRNKIRNEIVPKLNEINDRAVEHMAMLQKDMAEIADYLQDQTERLMLQAVRKEGDIFAFEVEYLDDLPDYMKGMAMIELMEMASNNRSNLSREHAMSLVRLAEGEVGKELFLPYGMKARKSYQELLLIPEGAEERTERIQPIEIDIHALEDFQEKRIKLPNGWLVLKKLVFDREEFPLEEIPKSDYTKWIDYDTIKNTIWIRNRLSGDYIQTTADGHGKKVKDYFIDSKIPQQKRDEIVMVAEESNVLWMVGYRFSERYKVSKHTRRVLQITYEEENNERDSENPDYRR